MRASSKLKVEQRVKHLERALETTGEIDKKLETNAFKVDVGRGKMSRTKMRGTRSHASGCSVRTIVSIPFQEHQASLPEGIGDLKKNSGDPADKDAGKVEARKIAHDKRAKGPNHPR